MDRRKDFKKGIAADDCRHKRSESQNHIRKNKRNEGLLKRRMMMTESDDGSKNQVQNSTTIPSTIESLPTVKALFDECAANVAEHQVKILDATKAVRKLLSRETNPPVTQVLEAGLLPHLIGFLKHFDLPTLQFEAAWALTNIGSTDQTAKIVEAGIVELLVPLLMVSSDELREQAAWCLGNIAGDCAEYRDMVLRAGALEGLIANLKQPYSIEMKRNTMWTLSNLCRGRPHPEHKLVAPIIPVLFEILNTETDVEVLTDACWSLTYLSDGPDERIQHVAYVELITKLVEHIKSSYETQCSKVITPALRALGNILTGSDTQTQMVLDAGFLRVLTLLISYPKQAIMKEACWAASNITAGNRAQIGSFLAMPGLPEAIVNALVNQTFDIKKEAHWTIANICTNGTPEHIQCIVQRYEVIQPLCELLELDDPVVQEISLDALSSILKVDPETFGAMVEECGGLDMIDQLQQHQDAKIFNKAVAIIENYFELNDEEEEGFTQTNENGEFSFNPENAENMEPNSDIFNGTSKAFSFSPAVEQTQRQLHFGQEKFVQ